MHMIKERVLVVRIGRVDFWGLFAPLKSRLEKGDKHRLTMTVPFEITCTVPADFHRRIHSTTDLWGPRSVTLSTHVDHAAISERA